MTTDRRNLISYTFVAAFSVAMLVWGIPAYSPEYPGYGVPASTLPNVAAGFMLFLSALGLLQTLLGSRHAGKKEETAPVASIRWGHLARFFVPCILLMPAMKLVGFIPAGIAFLVLIQLFCGQKKPLVLLLVAVVPVLVMYGLMRYGLGVPMP